MNETALPDFRIETFWQSFLSQTGRSPDTPYFSCDHFESSEELCNALLSLVLAGTKRATSSSLPAYHRTGDRVPRAGDLSIFTDWAGNPCCVVETTGVSILPFRDITFDIAAREGEDATLASWQEGHRRFFKEDARALGYSFTEDMPVVFEDFRLLYPLPGEDEKEDHGS